MGRPLKLTQRTSDTVCDAIRKGATREGAAVAAGIGRSTLQAWLAEGAEHPSGKYRDFLDAVCKAEEELQNRAAGVIVDLLGSGDERSRLNAAKFILSHRFPGSWSTRKEVRNTGPNGGPIEVKAEMTAAVELRPLVSREDLAELTRAEVEAALAVEARRQEEEEEAAP